MNRIEFETMLQEAVSGSHEALEQLFLLYAPLIDKHSKIDGQIDERFKTVSIDTYCAQYFKICHLGEDGLRFF